MRKLICLFCAILLSRALYACTGIMNHNLFANTETSSADATLSEVTIPSTTEAAEIMIPSTVAPAAPSEDTEATGEYDEIPFPLQFTFSSGAGGWGTVLLLNSDYTFNGSFHDSDMGDLAPEYPGGTAYISTFSGRFENITQLDEYSYSLELTQIEMSNIPGEEWIEDGIRYIATDPYGLEGTQYTLYLPDTPVNRLSDEFLSWWPYRYEQGETLSCFGILNETNGHGFFTYE